MLSSKVRSIWPGHNAQSHFNETFWLILKFKKYSTYCDLWRIESWGTFSRCKRSVSWCYCSREDRVCEYINKSLLNITYMTLKKLCLLWMSLTSLCQLKSSRTDSSCNAFQIWQHHPPNRKASKPTMTTVVLYLCTRASLRVGGVVWYLASWRIYYLTIAPDVAWCFQWTGNMKRSPLPFAVQNPLRVIHRAKCCNSTIHR